MPFFPNLLRFQIVVQRNNDLAWALMFLPNEHDSCQIKKSEYLALLPDSGEGYAGSCMRKEKCWCLLSPNNFDRDNRLILGTIRKVSCNILRHNSPEAEGLMLADRDSCELLRAIALRPTSATAEEIRQLAEKVRDWGSLFKLAA